MDEQTSATNSRVRQITTYCLMFIGFVLLITLVAQGISQVDNQQVVEGKPSQYPGMHLNPSATNVYSPLFTGSPGTMETLQVQPPSVPNSSDKVRNDDKKDSKTPNDRIKPQEDKSEQLSKPKTSKDD